MKNVFALLLLACLWTGLRAQEGEEGGEAEGEGESFTTATGCAISHERLYVLFRELFEEGLAVYVNCLSFDEVGALDEGYVSGVNETSGVSGPGSLRLELSCVEGAILAMPSNLPPLAQNMTSTACLSCVEGASPCLGACQSPCQRCYGTTGACTRCIACIDSEPDHCYVEEGSTEPLASSSCNSRCSVGQGLVINTERFNFCDCPSGYYRELINRPTAIEIEPKGTCEFFPVLEPFMCVPASGGCTTGGFEPNEELDHTCFACGLEYCLRCDFTTQHCLECLRNTVLFEDECFACPLAVVALNAEEQEHELEEEVEDQRLRQIELAVSLPILSVLVIILFLGMSLFAHLRYPHLNPRGHKRHRTKPEDFIDTSAEVASSGNFEPTSPQDVWRSRPTVRLR